MKLLEQIILQAIEQKVNAKNFVALKQRLSSISKNAQPSNQSLLKVYRKMKIAAYPILEKILKTREIRTLSGVAVVTVLTKPYPCPGACIYCPTDARMPKSYLPDEPAAARALSLKFNPYEQVKQRIKMLEMNGHDTDKIELIVKGGTWSAYPRKYQEWFIQRCFEAANPPKFFGRNSVANKKAKKLRRASSSLSEAQKINETAEHRINIINREFFRVVAVFFKQKEKLGFFNT